ncbi:unnamed protein product [Linum trigynum]|uniref:Peptidase S8/S53 domain-containing protein n=1 Tax=Linum trigynum TaxID=586398 RepID=A0AAV2FSC1_9ROSI
MLFSLTLFPPLKSRLEMAMQFWTLEYIRTTENPSGTILVGETSKDEIAPYVASFSSRGSNRLNPEILKPDITAPGVDILVVWSPVSSTSGSPFDTREVKFGVISGTSTSCSHTSAIAAYVKALQPDWSPAAIKSAIMTTANVMDVKWLCAQFGF